MMRRWMPLAWLAALALLLLALGRGFSPARQTLPSAPGSPGAELTASVSGDTPSCKPSVPLQIELLPSTQPDRWTLHVRSLDMDRDVVLRMGSDTDANSPALWQGRLIAGREESLEIRFAPTGNASGVWASLEVMGLGDEAMRAVAYVTRPGAPAAELASETSLVLQNPETGEGVIQFTGQVEEKR